MPGVGRNLQEHPLTGVGYELNQPIGFENNLRFDRLAWNVGRFMLGMNPGATQLPVTSFGFMRTREGLDRLDIMGGRVSTARRVGRSRSSIRPPTPSASRTARRLNLQMKMVAVEKLKVKDVDIIQAELGRFRRARDAVRAGDRDAFFPMMSPGWLHHFVFAEHYKSEEEFLFALAEVLRPEYEAVVEAGFILQLDGPDLPNTWLTLVPNITLEKYRERSRVRVEAVNHALRNIPETGCVITCAGAAGASGTARTSTTSHSRRSST